MHLTSQNVNQDVTDLLPFKIPGLEDDYRNDYASDPYIEWVSWKVLPGFNDHDSCAAKTKIEKIAKVHNVTDIFWPSVFLPALRLYGNFAPDIIDGLISYRSFKHLNQYETMGEPLDYKITFKLQIFFW